MGQFFELTFLTDDRIEQDRLRGKLAELGVTGKKWDGHLKGGGYGSMTWARSVKPLDLVVANYGGNWNEHFVQVGFDSAALRSLATLVDRKHLVDEFLVMGSHLWQAFPFYEGALSPEEEGWFLYSMRQSNAKEIQRSLPLNKYATFLSVDAALLVKPKQWVPQTHPNSTITSLERQSLLVIWDASIEGLARFLSTEFSIN